MPEVPAVPGQGLPVRLHDTSTGGTRPDVARTGRLALRLRHHPLRRHPPRPRGDLRRLRPAEPRVARRRAPGALRAERHRRRRPAAGAGDRHRGRLARPGRPRDRPVPRGHDGARRAPAGRVPRGGRDRPARRLGRRAAGEDRRGVPGGGRRARPGLVLRGGERPALRRGGEPGPRADAGAVRRARRRSRRRRQARPARPAAVARGPRRRAVVGRRVPRRGPARLAHRVRRHRAGAPRPAARRQRRRVRPGVPAPRDGGVARARAHRQLAVRAVLQPRRDGRASTARR